MRRIVILGTGTSVGKTYIAVALAQALRESNPDAALLALKPIESGVPLRAHPNHEPSQAADATALARANTVRCPEPNPLYRLPDPVSPHLAARRAGLTISLQSTAAWIAAAERTLPPPPAHSYLIVETAGGALTPISPTATNFHLALLLPDATWILVAPDCLGVLHDVASTCTALRSLGRSPDYLVITASRPADPSTGSNTAELQLFHPSLPVLNVPRDSPGSLRPLARLLAP